MRTLVLAIAVSLGAAELCADIVVAQHTLRPKTIIQPGHLAIKAGEILGTYDRVEDVIGQETRVAIYAGRPIQVEDIGPPATVERNQLVSLVYRRGGLVITAEGRSLGRGAPGERVRVMNLESKSTLTGRIRQDGVIEIQ